MTNKERNLIKVIMEYDNGDREYIDGDDVKRWQSAVNGAIILDYTHGAHAQEALNSVVWKKLN